MTNVIDLFSRAPRHGISPPLLPTPLPPRRAGRCDGGRLVYLPVGPLDAFGEPQDVVELECRGCPNCRRAA